MYVRDIYEFLNSIAPFHTAESWDNSGLILGSQNLKCNKIMLALDVTRSVVNEAVENNVDLIITHHPVIFSPLKTIEYNSNIARLISANISVISTHTCFDIAQGGMNDILCDKLGLINVKTVSTDDGFSFRLGTLKNSVSAKEFARATAEALNSKCVNCSLGEKQIKTIAVCSGAGGSFSELVIKLGVDAFVTGELKYNNVIELYESGVSAIVAGHFETEQIFKDELAAKLTEKFKDVTVILAKEESYLTGV